MSNRLIIATVILGASAVPAASQNFSALIEQANNGGLSFEQARAELPRLDRVIFEKADASGDGVIDGAEAVQLETLYREAYMSN